MANFKKALIIFGGLILGLAYNWPIFWFLSLAGFLPFFYIFYKKTPNLKGAFLYGWLFGFVFLGFTLAWFWQTLPLDWIEVESKVGGFFMVFATWFLPVFILSFFIGWWSFFCFKLKRKNIIDVFIFAFLWILFEYLRAWGFALLTVGKESTLTPHFSAGFLGYSLAPNHNLLQLAGFGGIYLLSFTVILISGLIYWLLFLTNFSLKKKITSLAIFILIFLAVVSVPFKNEPKIESNLKIAVLNTYFPSYTTISEDKFLKRFETRKKLIENIIASEEKPDIIFLPEDSRFLKTMEEQGINIANFLKQKKILIVDSSAARDKNNKMYSQIYYRKEEGAVVGGYNKNSLVPVGEYLPYIIKLTYKILGQSDVLKTLEENRAYSKGSSLQTIEYKNAKIAAAFCSELLSPDLYSRFTTEKNADVLVNLSSQSRFHGSKILFNQTLNISKVRAVENNRYLIMAANFFPSFILDNKGNITAMAERDKNSVLYGEVKLIKIDSFYNKLNKRLKIK